MDSPTQNQTLLSSEKMKEAAESLVRRGYQLVLLYGAVPKGVCTCRRWRECKSSGKHPLERDWAHRAIRTVSELESRWQRAPATPNIGIIPTDDMVVVDVDRKNGKQGAETLERLQRQHGPLGEPHQTTPSGGWHFVFRLPKGADATRLPNRSGVLDGFDILRSGRQFVAASSQVGDRRYVGSLPSRAELPKVPAEWLNY
jgi:hypothetical protein